jgi:hypothetical protein
MSTFQEFRKQKYAEQQQINNQNLKNYLSAAKLRIDDFTKTECTPQNCERALKRAKVPEGSISKLDKNGHIGNMAKTRGVSIEALLADDQKISALSKQSIKQTLDEKIQIQFWNTNHPDRQIKKGRSRRFVIHKNQALTEETDYNTAMRNLVSYFPSRLGGIGRAIGGVAQTFRNIMKRVDRSKTTIERNNPAERFNSSRDFDGELTDQHGNFKGYVISMKYQNPTSGGAQDRQKDDVNNTVRMCAHYIRTNPTEKDLVFYLIMDGGGLVPRFVDELKRHVDQEGVGNRIFVRTNSN